MAGRGTDIILGVIATIWPVQVREVLLTRLVKPEDDHKPALPLHRRELLEDLLMPLCQRSPAVGNPLSRPLPTVLINF